MAGSNATRFGVPRRPVGAQQEVGATPAASLPTIQYSTGAAQVLQQFSRDMFALGNQMHDRLDAQAEEESSQEGALDAMAGEFTPREDFSTIRNRAYNKAGLETFITTMETNSILKVEALKQQFANDPVALERELRAYRTGAMTELSQIDPRLGAGFDQRFTMRSLPAVEAAKDNAYRLTREQADASIIQSEVALKAELRTVAADLFSENPERSSAAAQAVGMVQADMMRVFDAVDPTTGRPLYNAVEREKARQGFYETVMESAALSWFDQQENKADAYLKFTGDEFTINLTTPGADPSLVVMANQGATRDDPLQPGLTNQLAVAAAALGPGVKVVVHSGGQENNTTNGTGSTRHNHGGAGDVRLEVNGKVITPAENRGLYLQFAQNVAAAGATGIGIDEGGQYLHVGGGPKSAWGYGPNGGKAEYLPGDFAEAINNGWTGPAIDTNPVNNAVDVRAALPQAVMDRIETEMRQRISFTNQMADREQQQAEAVLTAQQTANDFEMTIAALAPAGTVDPETGQPFVKPTLASIADATRNGFLSATAAKALTRALTVEAPQASETELYRDLLRRMHGGEDVRTMIYDNMARLSADDARSLLTQNNSLNVAGAGSLSQDQQFYEARLKDTLEPDGMLAELDAGAEERKFLALDEYRQRVLAGESARAVAIELQDRAKVDEENAFGSALGTLIRPRFSVPSATPGQVDIAQSAQALQTALAENKISDDQYWQQAELLRRWNDLQERIARGEL